jgi:hypothetical protein
LVEEGMKKNVVSHFVYWMDRYGIAKEDQQTVLKQLDATFDEYDTIVHQKLTISWKQKRNQLNSSD